MAVYTTIDNPELYFQSVLWTGNGSNPRTITLDGSEGNVYEGLLDIPDDDEIHESSFKTNTKIYSILQLCQLLASLISSRKEIGPEIITIIIIGNVCPDWKGCQ